MALTATTSLAQAPDRLDSLLAQVARAHDAGDVAGARALVAARGLRLRPGDLVPVVLVPLPGRASASIDRVRLQALGATVEAVSPSFLRALVPLGALRRVAGHPGVSLTRAPIPAKAVAGLGPLVSESVGLTGAATLQDGPADLSGAGVRIAVVDLGFAGLAAAITAGELPASTITVDFTGTGVETGTEHGTGVAEHVMDMAPGATLYCLKIGDEVDLQNAATYIRDNAIVIANHSVAWVNASYYDDTGPINQIINASHDADGVFWAVAAGNSARAHWRGVWTDADVNRRIEFSGTDELLGLTLASSTVQVFLNWDQYAAPVTDLDLIVVDRDGVVVAQSQTRQGGILPPEESLGFPFVSASAPYSVRVEHVSGPTAGLDLTLFSFNNDFEYPVASSSLPDPATAHGAFTVGAINQSEWNAPSPSPEAFSSQGPTTDGRQKPDIAAPDGTTSLTYGVRRSFGTSFAAPTLAGAAALYLERDPALESDPAALAALLRGDATDIGATGPDPVFGAGKLALYDIPNTPPDAESATVTAAEDVPSVITLTGTDAEGDPLTFRVVSGPSDGTLSGTPPDVTYTPDADFNGVDSFEFVAHDGRDESAPGTITVVVAPAEDAPVATPQTVVTDPDAPLVVTLTGTDADGDLLTFTVETQPANGTVTGVPPDVTYTPAPGYAGPDSFTFTAHDLTRTSAPATVTVQVNRAPAADAQALNVTEGTTAAITLTGSDPDDDALTYAVTSAPSNGTLSGTAPALRYTPASGYLGPDAFSFVVNDGRADSAPATVSITVRPNAAPQVTIVTPRDRSTAPSNTSITFSATAIDAENGDVSGTLRWTVDGDEIGQGGQFSTRRLEVGTHDVVATATDANGATASASVRVTVTAGTVSAGAGGGGGGGGGGCSMSSERPAPSGRVLALLVLLLLVGARRRTTTA